MTPRDKIKQVVFGARYGLRLWRARRVVLAHLAHSTPALPMPAFVQLQLTNLCDLRCRMCGQWGTTGVLRPSADAVVANGETERSRIRELIGVGQQLGLSEYLRLLDQLVPFNPVVGLFGGEPLLYPDIVALAHEIKRRGLTLTLITNGTLLERYARELVSAGIDSLAVSLDGPPDLHDSIRGRAGSFARTAAGVRAVAEARTERKKSRPVLFAILPITELNFESIPASVAALKALPLDAINIGLRWYVTTEAGIAHQEVMRQVFAVTASSWKGFEFAWPGGKQARDSSAMRDLVLFLRSLRRRRVFDAMVRRRPWISFVPDLQPEDVPQYLTDPAGTFGHDFCPAPWYFAQVQPSGEVVICGDFPDYSLGNVRQQAFAEIWRGQRASAFRERILQEPLPICKRCCSRYVYGRWPVPPQPARPAP